MLVRIRFVKSWKRRSARWSSVCLNIDHTDHTIAAYNFQASYNDKDTFCERFWFEGALGDVSFCWLVVRCREHVPESSVKAHT